MLPGDPIMVMAGERGMTPERYEELVKQFGFDRPILDAILRLHRSVLHGDLGNSFVTKKPIWDEFFTLFPATLELATCAMIFAIALGIPAGVIAAVYRGKFFDQRAHVDRANRLLDADLLVGAASDHRDVGLAGADAGVGADQP